MKWFREHIYGILGTLIVHLVLAIAFMVFKISTFKPYLEEPVVISFEPEEPLPQPDDAEKNAIIDAELQQMIHNIAVNRALNQDENFDINQYIDQVKNEMIEKGELNENNFIDQWRKKQQEEEGDIRAELPEKSLANDTAVNPSEIMAANYAGPTRVEYYLENRFATHMEIPVYKCEGSGTVVVRIEVSREGMVISANPEKDKSSRNECMLTSAREAALQSTFNKDPGAPALVAGTITYYFVAQ